MSFPVKKKIIWQKVPVNKLEKELILRNGFFPVSINTELDINVMYRCQFLCNFFNIFKIIIDKCTRIDEININLLKKWLSKRTCIIFARFINVGGW